MTLSNKEIDLLQKINPEEFLQFIIDKADLQTQKNIYAQLDKKLKTIFIQEYCEKKVKQ